MSTPPAAQSSGAALYARLLGHVQRYWPIAVLVVLAMVIDAACMGLFAQSIKPMLDDLFVARDPQTIFWMPIVIVAIFLVRSVAVYVTDYGTAYIGRGVVQQL
ncbi:partial Lipid A export ATP-binding/permease protein MsbA, partial [uncultured bacterium]